MIDYPRSRSKVRQNARLNTSKTQSYQGFASFMGVEMSVEKRYTLQVHRQGTNCINPRATKGQGFCINCIKAVQLD